MSLATQVAMRRFAKWAPEPNGTDDTAAFTALDSSLPTNGGVIVLRPGTYKLPSGFTFTKRVMLVGAGAGQWENQSTRIEVSSATANGLEFTVDGSQARTSGLINTSGTRATAGAGILMTKGDWSRIDRLLIDAFYNNIQYDAGFYYSIADCAILNPRNYGIYCRNTAFQGFDHGDQVIEGCTITKFGDTVAGGTAVKWESGGGLRFVGNKINGGNEPNYNTTAKFVDGLSLAVADGYSTSNLIVTGNSIENCTGGGVLLKQLGPNNTGFFSKVVVTGNEIAIGGTGVVLDMPASGYGSLSTISGNVFTNLSASIFLRRIVNVMVGSNLHNVVATIVQAQTGCQAVYVAKQAVNGDNILLWRDATYGSTAHTGISMGDRSSIARSRRRRHRARTPCCGVSSQHRTAPGSWS